MKPHPVEEKLEEYNSHFHDESEFELDPDQYHQLDLPAQTAPVNHHSSILAQQNKEYEEMEKSYIAKLAED